MITREDIMIENIAIKRIGFLNKKQKNEIKEILYDITINSLNQNKK